MNNQLLGRYPSYSPGIRASRTGSTWLEGAEGERSKGDEEGPVMEDS